MRHTSKFTAKRWMVCSPIGFEHHQQIIWNKGRTVLTRTHYWFQHEPAGMCARKTCPGTAAGRELRVWESPSPKFIMRGSEKDKFDHPTQKPLELMRRPIVNQCHSPGQPLSNPIEGKYYDWPVGYNVGKKLQDYWKLEEPTLGAPTNFLYYPDGTAHKNRMQGNDFVQSVMYTRGVTCFDCHDVHGTGNYAQLRKPPDQLCLAATVPLHRTVHAQPRSKSTRVTSMAVREANASRPYTGNRDRTPGRHLGSRAYSSSSRLR